MLKATGIVATWFVALGLGVTPAGAESVNLVGNPDFEAPEGGSDKKGTNTVGWTEINIHNDTPNGSEICIETAADKAHKGDQFIVFGPGTNWSGSARTCSSRTSPPSPGGTTT